MVLVMIIGTYCTGTVGKCCDGKNIILPQLQFRHFFPAQNGDCRFVPRYGDDTNKYGGRTSQSINRIFNATYEHQTASKTSDHKGE